MRLRALNIIVFICIADLVSSLIPNLTRTDEVRNDLKRLETRRKKKNKRQRSTSSSEGAIRESSSDVGDKESLELSSHELTTSTSEEKIKPKSSEERKGWRKWHRKCPPCPEDMAKKWRDPTIKWICGGYQRARRSFKSLCMMHYRNCQDGTMFVKLYDHRCANDTLQDQPHGVHFFYDYQVNLSGESTGSSNIESSVQDSSSDW